MYCLELGLSSLHTQFGVCGQGANTVESSVIARTPIVDIPSTAHPNIRPRRSPRMDISNMGAPHLLDDRWIDSGFGLLPNTKAFFAPARASPETGPRLSISRRPRRTLRPPAKCRSVCIFKVAIDWPTDFDTQTAITHGSLHRKGDSVCGSIVSRRNECRTTHG